MDFGEVLGKAWRIIWKHKVLWIFGILAGCGSGGGGGGSGASWQENRPFGPGGTSEFERALRQAGQWIGDHPWIVVLAILALLLVAVVAIFLGTIGKIGLIRGTVQADAGAETLRFGDLFRESRRYFWRVFLLSFLIGLAVLILFMPLALFGALTGGVGLLCIIPLLCILLPLLWAASIVVQQANAAMVIEDLKIVDGLRRGWEVVRRNIGPILIMWLITAVIGVTVGIAIALPMLVVVVPAAIGFATSGGNLPTAALLVSGLCFVLYLPILVVAQGILTGYVGSVWALTFLRLTKPSATTALPPSPPANA